MHRSVRVSSHVHVPRAANIDIIGLVCEYVCKDCRRAVTTCKCQDQSDAVSQYCRECGGSGWVLVTFQEEKV